MAWASKNRYDSRSNLANVFLDAAAVQRDFGDFDLLFGASKLKLKNRDLTRLLSQIEDHRQAYEKPSTRASASTMTACLEEQ